MACTLNRMRRTGLWLCCFATLALGCSGDDGGGANIDGSVADADPNAPDAMPVADAGPPPDACTGQTPLEVQDDGTGRASPVIITEISIAGNYVELFNPGLIDVDLGALVSERWCDQPSYPFLNRDPIVVRAGEFRTIDFDFRTGATAEDGGELAIYANGGFGTGTNVLDFVCWGTPRSAEASRRDEANAGQKWDVLVECSPAIPSGGALRRIDNKDGANPADYEPIATPDPTNCGP